MDGWIGQTEPGDRSGRISALELYRRYINSSRLERAVKDADAKSPGICMIPSLWRRAKQSKAKQCNADAHSDLVISEMLARRRASHVKDGSCSGDIHIEFVGSHFAKCQMIWET